MLVYGRCGWRGGGTMTGARELEIHQEPTLEPWKRLEELSATSDNDMYLRLGTVAPH
jgi:hypothetical protein